MADNSLGGRRRYVLLLMVLTAITLATLDSRAHSSGPIGAAGRVAHRVVQPVSDAASSVFSPFHDWWHGFTHHGDIVKENRALKQQLQQAQADARAGHDAAAQNRVYARLFQFPFQTDYPNVNARVTADGAGNFEGAVTLNVGSEHHIASGMAVVGPLGMIGRISRVWNGGSTVLLVSDPNFGIDVRPLLSTQWTTAHTASDGQLKATFEDDRTQAQSAVKLHEQDTIITCGCDNSDYPLGIPVGTARSAIRAQDRSEVNVVLHTYLDRRSLEFVKVITWRRGDPTPATVTATTKSKPTTKSTSQTTASTTSSTPGH